MSKPIIYSKNSFCVACLRTKTHLDVRNYDYEERIVNPDADEKSDDPQEVKDALLIKQFKERGFSSFPIVQYGDTLDQAWSGHQDNLLNEHYPARP